MTQTFAQAIITWQQSHGRHDLPWQHARDAYRVWVSEIMLQQTQVSTVIPYYQRFMQRFPDVRSLATAAGDDVLAAWSGLGYYSRARNLHRAARLIVERHGGAFPSETEAIAALPGIGRSTAAAIAALAFGERCAILDGNVKRILARHFGIEGFPGAAAVERRLWTLAESLLPERDIETYTQGIMDLGATVCTRAKPACDTCPVGGWCVARTTARTAELPQRRPRRTVPLRRTAMLLIRCAGEILLEKRPPTGVWAGLWCLPQMPPDIDVTGWCREHFGVEVVPAAPLTMLAHGFTHFKLEILPRPVDVVARPPRVCEPGRVWMLPDDALGAAIPAPVRKLLLRAAEAPPPASSCGSALRERIGTR